MTKANTKIDLSVVKEALCQDADFLKLIVQSVLQEIFEAEMSDALQAEKSERTASRLGYRSGYYSRSLITRVGAILLRRLFLGRLLYLLK